MEFANFTGRLCIQKQRDLRLAKFADAESETKAAANAKKGAELVLQPLLGSKEAAEQAAKKKKEVDDFISSLGPDGYVITEENVCFCSTSP